MRDLQNTYSDAQALTSTGNTDSTNIINQLAAGDTFDAPFIRLKVNTTFTSGGSGTLAANLITDSDPAFGVAPVTYPLFSTTALTSLTAGKVLYQGRLPIGMKQYHKVQWVVGTAAMTAGKVDAFLTDAVPTNKM
jgi:hypothetical protein